MTKLLIADTMKTIAKISGIDEVRACIERGNSVVRNFDGVDWHVMADSSAFRIDGDQVLVSTTQELDTAEHSVADDLLAVPPVFARIYADKLARNVSVAEGFARFSFDDGSYVNIADNGEVFL